MKTIHIITLVAIVGALFILLGFISQTTSYVVQGNEDDKPLLPSFFSLLVGLLIVSLAAILIIISYEHL